MAESAAAPAFSMGKERRSKPKFNYQTTRLENTATASIRCKEGETFSSQGVLLSQLSMISPCTEDFGTGNLTVIDLLYSGN